MTYYDQTKSTIQARFNTFHKENPVVYRMIRTAALTLIKRGAKKISIKRVINDIRWDKYIVIKEPTLFESEPLTKRFKINDAFTSRYNRLFVAEFPELIHRLEQRKLRSL